MTNPTLVHERREVYRGRVFSLSVDRVTLPSGHTATMDIVRHPGRSSCCRCRPRIG